MSLIPPQPAGALPGSNFWNDWIEKIRFVVNNLSLGLINHNDLQNIQGGSVTERYHLTNAQLTSVTGLPTLVGNTYTPTITNGTNVAASTAYTCQYIRIGSVVHVSGRVDIDPTAAGATNFAISLPVASNLTSSEQCTGVIAKNATNEVGTILGDSANDRASGEMIAVDTTNRACTFTFTYRVL
jgi:hypothetical protein